MSLCERPTHWLPQNPLSFIINNLLLIIQALLHTMHILYIKGGRGRRERQYQAGRKREEESEEVKWLEREMWNLIKRTKQTEYGWDGAVDGTCHPWQPFISGLSPFHHLFHLHHITHFLSLPFHLLIEVFQLLKAWGKRERPITVRNVIDLRKNNASEAYTFIFPHMHLFAKFLFLSINFCNVWKASQTVLRVHVVKWKNWQRADSLGSDR